jgi:hypothetical protein
MSNGDTIGGGGFGINLSFDWGKSFKEAAQGALEQVASEVGTGTPTAGSSVAGQSVGIDVGNEPPTVDVNPIDASRSRRQNAFTTRHGLGEV